MNELVETIILEERAAWGHFLVQLERLRVATDNANNAWDEYQAALAQMTQLAPGARHSDENQIPLFGGGHIPPGGIGPDMGQVAE